MNARERVLASMDALGDDELEVLAEVATGLHAGHAIYGEMQISRDARDFEREALDEARDGLVYVAAALIRARRARLPAWTIPPAHDPADAPPGARVLWGCEHGVGDRPCGRCHPVER